MRRGLVLFIGLAILATGIWMIATEHSRTAACNASFGTLGSLPGFSNSCQSVAWVYFGGFVATGLGLLVLLFAGLVKRHELRYRRPADKPTEFSLRDVGADQKPQESIWLRPIGPGAGRRPPSEPR